LLILDGAVQTYRTISKFVTGPNPTNQAMLLEHNVQGERLAA
jgi:hypothetical protein